MIKEATKIIIVCVVRRVSCGDRTTTTESELSVHTVNIGASVCIQYGNTPCLPIINSTNNQWNNRNICVALLFVVSLLVSCGELQRRERERVGKREEQSASAFSKKTVIVYVRVHSTVMLNAFPLKTVDKKLFLEVKSKLERLEYS